MSNFKSLNDFDTPATDGILCQGIADALRFWMETITVFTQYERPHVYIKLGVLLGAYARTCENDGGDELQETVMMAADTINPLDDLLDTIKGYTSELDETEMANSDLPDMLTRIAEKARQFDERKGR